MILLLLVATYQSFPQDIHRMACSGDVVKLDSMLQSSDINVLDDRGRSLLHWAVACKKMEVFSYLLDKGLDINSADLDGFTPMYVAVQFNNELYLDTLISLQPTNEWTYLNGASLLEKAILNKNLLFVEKLISSGVDINILNDRGSTPLEIAKRSHAKAISSFLISEGADESKVRSFQPEGEYMGETPPKLTPKIFAPLFVSSEEYEFGSIFNASGEEFYYGVDASGGNEIRFSQMENGKWSSPILLLFDEKYGYNDPFLTPEENRLFFISNRALDGKGEPKDIDIWYVERKRSQWSEPINAGPNINSKGEEYYISFTNAGTMYFASNGLARPDTARKDHDIYYAELIDGEFQKPVLLSDAINTPNYEADVFVAPDESYLIFCSSRPGGLGRGDLYISFKTESNEWSPARNLGEPINTEGHELCPFVTADGQYLFYTSNQDIYWVSTDILRQYRN